MGIPDYSDDELKAFYKAIENAASYRYYSPPIPDREKLSPKDQFVVSIEFNAFLIPDRQRITEVFGERKNEVKVYLESRVESSGNRFLQARYNYFLAVLTRDNRYLKLAFDYYFLLLCELLSATDEDDHFSNITYLVEECLGISLNIKYQKDQLKAILEDMLLNPVLSERIRCSILESLEVINIRASESECLPILCYRIAYLAKEPVWKEKALKAGRFFVEKFKHLEKVKNKILCLSGDLEMQKAADLGSQQNIIVPHLRHSHYEKAIDFYKEGKDEVKSKIALGMYETNKKAIRFAPITIEADQSKIHEINLVINNYIDELLSLPPHLLIIRLSLGLFVEHLFSEPIPKDSSKTYSYLDYFVPKQADINLNFQEKDKKAFENKISIDLKMKALVDLYLKILKRIFEEGKISFRQLYCFLLRNTFFGTTLLKNGSESRSYNWYYLIHEGLVSFLNSFDAFRKGHRSSFMLSTDSLTTKFEGIIRDIVGLSGGNISKKDNNGNIVARLLDELLSDISLEKTFSKDDIAFFKYVFTRTGPALNIRNDLAHGFYIPQDYSFKKALLVIMCIFRLIKFVPPKRDDKEI